MNTHYVASLSLQNGAFVIQNGSIIPVFNNCLLSIVFFLNNQQRCHGSNKHVYRLTMKLFTHHILEMTFSLFPDTRYYKQ